MVILLHPSEICDNIVDVPVRIIGFDVYTKQFMQFVGFALISIVPVREVHFLNIISISVTLLGIVEAVVREVQPKNVLDIFVTPSGISGATIRDTL